MGAGVKSVSQMSSSSLDDDDDSDVSGDSDDELIFKRLLSIELWWFIKCLFGDFPSS